MSPSIDSQRRPKVGMDMFRLCRLDGHVLLIEEMNKVTGDRQVAISNFRCVPSRLQMSTELSQAGMNLHEHLLGDFQGVPYRPGSDLCEAEIAAIQHQTRAAAIPAHNPVLHINSRGCPR